MGFSSLWTENFQMYKLGSEKAEEPKIQLLANISYIIEKAGEFHKNIYFCLTDFIKALTMWSTTNCGKILKEREYQTTLPVSWETYMQVEKQPLDLDMKQWTGLK